MVAEVKLQGLEVHSVFRDRLNPFLPRAAGVFSGALPPPPPRLLAHSETWEIYQLHTSPFITLCVCVGVWVVGGAASEGSLFLSGNAVSDFQEEGSNTAAPLPTNSLYTWITQRKSTHG